MILNKTDIRVIGAWNKPVFFYLKLISTKIFSILSEGFTLSNSLEGIFSLTKSSSTAQKIKFSIKDFFNKCDQICRKLPIWSHLLKKSLMENSFFLQCRPPPCSVLLNLYDEVNPSKINWFKGNVSSAFVSDVSRV